MLYITAELKESILVVDPKERKMVGTITTGSNTTHFFAMTKDEKKMFTSNVSAATVSVLDIPGRKLITNVSTGGGNQRMTVSPDDKWFVTSVGNTRSGTAFFRTSSLTSSTLMSQWKGRPSSRASVTMGRRFTTWGMRRAVPLPPHFACGMLMVRQRRWWPLLRDILVNVIVESRRVPSMAGCTSAVTPVRSAFWDPDTLKVVKQFTAPATTACGFLRQRGVVIRCQHRTFSTIFKKW